MDIWLTLAAIVGIVGLIGLAILAWFRKFDIKVIILTELSGGGIEVKTDYARLFEGDISQTRYVRLWKAKRELTNVLDKHLIANTDGGFAKKPYLAFLLKASNGQYYWLDPKNLSSSYTFKPVDYNVLNWIRQNIVEAFERWKQGSWLERYMPLIVIIIIGLVTLGATYIIYDKMSKNVDSMAGASNNLAEAINRLVGYQNSTNESKRLVFVSDPMDAGKQVLGVS